MTKRVFSQTPPPLIKVRKNSISPWESDEITQIQSPLKKYLKSQKQQVQQILRLNPQNYQKRKQTIENFLPKFQKRIKIRQSRSIRIQPIEKEVLLDRNQITVDLEENNKYQISKTQQKNTSARLKGQKGMSNSLLVQGIQRMLITFNEVVTPKKQNINSLSNRKSIEDSSLQNVRNLIKEIQNKKYSNISSIFTLPQIIFTQEQGCPTPILYQKKKKIVKRSWKIRSRTICKA